MSLAVVRLDRMNEVLELEGSSLDLAFAEFDLAGTMTVLSFTPMNRFFNAGDLGGGMNLDALLLAPGLNHVTGGVIHHARNHTVFHHNDR